MRILQNWLLFFISSKGEKHACPFFHCQGQSCPISSCLRLDPITKCRRDLQIMSEGLLLHFRVFQSLICTAFALSMFHIRIEQSTKIINWKMVAIFIVISQTSILHTLFLSMVYSQAATAGLLRKSRPVTRSFQVTMLSYQSKCLTLRRKCTKDRQ